MVRGSKYSNREYHKKKRPIIMFSRQIQAEKVVKDQGRWLCDWSKCREHYFCQQSAGKSGTAGYEAGCSLRRKQLYGQGIFPVDWEYEAVEHSSHTHPEPAR